ncbi:MAG TPA: DUF167 domain-containing protein [Mycobacteriales bacterium]|nr:DUF167 domain-containing protein [Mycobacteriales bacterium]
MRFTIRVRPGSTTERVGGDYDGALVIRVRERPVDGKATAAALRALADALGIARADVRLVAGGSARTKVVEIADGRISGEVEALRRGLPGG